MSTVLPAPQEAAAASHRRRAAAQTRTLLVLMQGRLDREAFAALAAADARFAPLAAPSLPTAQRILAEQGDPGYSVLMEPGFLAGAMKTLFEQSPPQSVVVLRRAVEPASRWRDRHFPIHLASADMPWRSVAGLLTGPSAETQTAPSATNLSPASTGIAYAESGEPAAPNGELERRLAALTRRERQVLELIAGGASVRECAESLHIAVSTVDNHKSRLMRKIGVRKSSELVRFAFLVGIAP